VTILDEIIINKRKEVAAAKLHTPVKELERMESFGRTPVSLSGSLKTRGKSGIIAEIKRKSPSKGALNLAVSIERTSVGYVKAGASALSILTDKQYFGGSTEDLLIARKLNACPILRKDFTIDEYQILEGKAVGADAILLIAAALSSTEAKRLANFAHTLKLEVLLEVHNEEELAGYSEVEADLIGVNNRNLKTFEVSIDVSKRLAPLIRTGVTKVAESGISDPAVIHDLKQYGYQGFLIGETFMRSSRPEDAASDFIDRLKRYGEVKA
jgi:indole-3-glycerol phosphate synthase